MPVHPSGVSDSQLLFADKHQCMRSYKHVVLTFSSDPPSTEYLKAWGRAVEDSVRSFNNVALLTVISDAAGRPSQATRRRFNEIVTRYEHVILRFAFVVEGQGFRAAAVRAGLSSLALQGRHRFPQAAFSGVPEAARWLTASPAPDTAGVIPATLERIVGQLRLDIARRAAAGQ